MNFKGLYQWLSDNLKENGTSSKVPLEILKPMGKQELWASGVTYESSRLARMEEAEKAGGGNFYAKVYHADRPELFFKSTPSRVVGPGQGIRIRRDSAWNVPEPELVLVINSRKEIIGITLGNDMSSRSIEGENPLYLPQAKTYDKCASVGPGILLLKDPVVDPQPIALSIHRDGEEVFTGKTNTANMKRTFNELVDYLFAETSFPHGVYLMTGTGIVPTAEFTLQVGDRIEISSPLIGSLINHVEK